MQRPCIHAVAAGALLLFGCTLNAQQPLPASPAAAPTLVWLTPATGQSMTAPPPALGSSLPAGPATAEYQPALNGDKESLFSLDIMIGQQLGIRSQLAVYRGDRQEVVGELFYGLLLHSLGSSEAIGGGGRYLVRRCSPDSTNAIVLGPGLDVFYQTDNNRLILLNPSVELSWLHGFGDRCGWEFGVNAGAGIAISGRTSHNESSSGNVTSLISLFTGFRF
jgi:hypothetical protein